MYLSEKNCRQLKKWGCDVRSDTNYVPQMNGDYKLQKGDIRFGFFTPLPEYPTYDLREIITNGEMAKAFFGEEEIERWSGGNCGYEDCIVAEYSHILHTDCIKNLLQQNKQKEAEDYFIDNCKFNPKNK